MGLPGPADPWNSLPRRTKHVGAALVQGVSVGSGQWGGLGQTEIGCHRPDTAHSWLRKFPGWKMLRKWEILWRKYRACFSHFSLSEHLPLSGRVPAWATTPSPSLGLSFSLKLKKKKNYRCQLTKITPKNLFSSSFCFSVSCTWRVQVCRGLEVSLDQQNIHCPETFLGLCWNLQRDFLILNCYKEKVKVKFPTILMWAERCGLFYLPYSHKSPIERGDCFARVEFLPCEDRIVNSYYVYRSPAPYFWQVNNIDQRHKKQ